MKPVLVTGATGFVGWHVARLLAGRGHNVRALSRSGGPIEGLEVEVVKGDLTSNETITTIISLAKQMGKTPVLCKDAPGFIVNHVARPYYLEALRLMEAGIADPETIDKLMEASGFKMGPFKLMDLIGNDVNYAVSTSLYEAMNKPARLKPSAIQKEKVEKGELGKKTGKGYYNY